MVQFTDDAGGQFQIVFNVTVLIGGEDERLGAAVSIYSTHHNVFVILIRRVHPIKTGVATHIGEVLDKGCGIHNGIRLRSSVGRWCCQYRNTS